MTTRCLLGYFIALGFTFNFSKILATIPRNRSELFVFELLEDCARRRRNYTCWLSDCRTNAQDAIRTSATESCSSASAFG